MVVHGFSPLQAQTCPPNIDFENGTLEGWKTFIGNVSNQGGNNVFSLTETNEAVPDRHTIIPAYSAGNDPYGGFPMRSPNGSAYCIKLGNDRGGGEGEAVSYEFAIPANRNTFSLIYYYAVVFQDPNHQIYEQPRMEIELTNITDNSPITCASFTFIPFGSALPGFFESPNPVDNTPIWCKDWTPVSVNLDGLAGKSIRLTFRTGDCTFRRHFGYAYIDVDSDCSGEFVGASFCPLDPEITVAAPFGFQNYQWLSSDRTRVLGTGQFLTLRPPPPSGTTVVVNLTPYPGYGCPQTLTAKLIDNLNFKANAGLDTLSCNMAPVRIGTFPRPGLVYSWMPASGLSSPTVANPVALPSSSTDYILTVRSPGGGCEDKDTVTVIASRVDTSVLVIGKPEYCIGSGDSAVLQVNPTQQIQWYKGNTPIAGAKNIRYRVAETGSYRAFLIDSYGCELFTPVRNINISSIPSADFLVNNRDQCLIGNRFTFSNGSTNAIGAMQYRWDLGAGMLSSQKDVAISYSQAGKYSVKLVVNSNSVCMDSMQMAINVFQNPVPVFDGKAICAGLPYLPLNNTDENIGSPIHYKWTFSHGRVYDEMKVPPEQVFDSPGSLSVTLAAYSDQCPTPVQTFNQTLRVESETPARRYPPAFAIVNIAHVLEARPLGVSALWDPATQLSDPKVFKPVFKGDKDQEYRIRIETEGGCVTVDTLLVQIVDRSEIYVPNAFTPNGDGLNDLLRPVLMGVPQLKYFRVFNRWGELIYETKTEKAGWDGQYKGNQQPSQHYVWMVEGVGIDGRLIQKKGTSLLIR